MIKPDDVGHELIGGVLHRTERHGFTIEKLEMRMAIPGLLEEYYADLANRPFFPLIVDFMTSGPVITGAMSGSEVITSWRIMMGVTSLKGALPGTIRGDYAQAPDEGGTTFNIVHGSDSPEPVEREIAFWFGE